MDCSLYHHLQRSGTVPRANTLSYHACTGFITTDHERVDEGTLLMEYIAIVRGAPCGVPSSQRMRLPLTKHCMGVREEHIGCEFQVLTATTYMFERIECIGGNGHWDWESILPWKDL